MSRTSFSTVALAAAALLAGSADAFWRMQCSGQSGIAQIDPIISPGTVSGHVHTIKGSSGFGLNPSVDDLLNAPCTSCEIKQDRSAYWTPALYFVPTNGDVQIVPEVFHVTYYKYVPLYTDASPPGQQTMPEALPNGFRMVSGDPFQRNYTWSATDTSQGALAANAIGFNCINDALPPEGSFTRHYLPTKSFVDGNCPGGLRLELLFPYCWTGALDSPDHKSHLAFPDGGANGGNCPPGFPKVSNQIMYETLYNTAAFAGQAGTFALANGDPTGYGFHGDVIIAWQDNILTEATAQCGPLAGDSTGLDTQCSLFDIADLTTQTTCKFPVPAVVAGLKVLDDMTALPGNNPLTYGPAYAKPAGGAAPAPAAAAAAAPAAAPAASGGQFVQKPSAPAVPVAANQNPAPSPSTTTTTPSPSPSTTTTTTTTPSTTPPPANTLPILTTKYFTDGATLIEEIVYEDVVYVTADSAPAPRRRRGHVHDHVGRHAHHRR